MKKAPTENEDKRPELSDAWRSALEMVDADLVRRGSAEPTRRAYASDLDAFARWAQSAGAEPGQVSARDVPGNLARITAIVAEAGANIDEVHHQRAFTLLAAQNVAVELVLQTRGREHVQQVIEALRTAGFDAQAA